MERSLLQEKYPVYILELDKSETEFQTTDDIVAYFKDRIDSHEITRYLGEFDHFAHTNALKDGSIQEGIIAAKNVMFCFGIALPKPEMLAVRPRSFGIAEYADRFVVSFMEAPIPIADETMKSWVEALVKPKA